MYLLESTFLEDKKSIVLLYQQDTNEILTGYIFMFYNDIFLIITANTKLLFLNFSCYNNISRYLLVTQKLLLNKIIML